MRAHVGDHLIVISPATRSSKREGEIVGLHHPDGSPPYDVRWSDTDHVTLVFPGPDACIRHREPGNAAPGSGADEAEARLTGSGAEEAPGHGLHRP
ncbi:DUF1918 domain-containing protein [Streptomyces sp. NPDC056061]|uniref:DUF1918 domain-containing protein n=1 Tax=Streptomyces sp. NPDC056061 TaxID=3345700 RepID=UPI0035DBF3AA